MSEKGAVTLQNVLLTGVAIAFGFTMYVIINKALKKGTTNA